MRKNRSFSLIAPVIIASYSFSAVSCRDRTSEKSTSSVKHVVGDTYVAGVRKPCRQDELFTEFPEAAIYLHTILEDIAKNNPQTFKDDLSPDKICVNVVRDPQLNAFASVDTNTIVFYSSLILQAESDSQIAAVLTHELAHLSRMSTHMRMPSYMVTDPAWPQIQRDFDIKNGELQRKLDLSKNDFNEVLLQMDGFRKSFVELSTKEPLQSQINALNKLAGELKSQLSDVKGLSQVDYYKYLNQLLTIPEINWSYYLGENGGVPVTPMGEGGPSNPRPNSSDQAHVKEIEQSFERVRKQVVVIQASIAEQDPKGYASYQQLLGRLDEIKKASDPINAQKKQLTDDFDNWVKQHSEEGAFYNWTEQEADEVGYELFLRSSYRYQDMIWLNAALLGNEDNGKCMSENVNKSIPPKRGSSTHPEHCWRIYDILVVEPKLHAQEYGSLIKAATKTTSIGGELPKIKELLAKPAKGMPQPQPTSPPRGD